MGFDEDKLDEIVPGTFLEPEGLAVDLANLIDTAETTQALAIEFPNPTKYVEITAQLGWLAQMHKISLIKQMRS